jgi:hypothetical protein
MRPQRQMHSRPFLPRPLRQKHRNQSEEQPCHLQPHHARKPRQRRPHRPPQLPGMLLRRLHGSLRLHHFLRHAINRRRRLSRCPRPRWRRRRRRIRRLHQRLRRMPSAISQRASETNPVHALQCTVRVRLTRFLRPTYTPSPSPASNPSRRSKSQSNRKQKGQA